MEVPQSFHGVWVEPTLGSNATQAALLLFVPEKNNDLLSAKHRSGSVLRIYKN
jgi:hypothetical protein